MVEPDPSVDLLAASLRLDADDLSMYAGFLLNTLSGALPPELVRITRKGGLRQRLAGGEPPVVEIAISLGERRFTLHRDAVGAQPRAVVAHEVGGVVLSTASMPLDEWARALAAGLLQRAGTNAATRVALERMLEPGSPPAGT
ncbi:MAG: hypothetical protein ACYDAQ_13735 [Mycobacteriales bacterium]